MIDNKKIAIVYDWFDKWGGVERVLLVFKEIFPKADFYTSYFDEKGAFWAKNFNLKTSFIQKLPRFIKKSRIFSLPFYPLAFESFDFSSYDLVISITSSFAKSVITHPKTKHICYLLTPTRFLWSHQKDYFKNNFLVQFYFNYLKKWDKIVSTRPDKIISISQAVKKRCQQYYKRDSKVIYPPFDIDYWNKVKSTSRQKKSKNFFNYRNFFLVVSRLELYKKIDLVIKVFNKLKENLIIIGIGSQEKRLKKLANKNITFLSNLSDIELGYFYSNALALIMPQEEDFGYVSLEAQFFGCPVIAYKKGGAIETVIENKTGLFFNNQNEVELLRAIETYHKIKYNLRQSILKFAVVNIKKFTKEKFIKNFLKQI